MKALDRKLVRDITRLKGQVITIAFVVAAGIASYVTLQSTYGSLFISREAFYDEYRFADVFVRLEQAPTPVREQLEEIAGVAFVETRVIADARLPMEGMAQPPIGQLVSIPADGQPALNGVHLVRGRFPEAGRDDEIVLHNRFAEEHDLVPGDTLPVVLEGRLQDVTIVGIGLSPEFVYPIAPGGDVVPDDERFAVMWMEQDALARAAGLEGAFNDASFRLRPGASIQAVLAEVDTVLDRYGGLGAVDRRRQPSHDILTSELEQLRSLATVVPIIFLGVAAFLLNVVLSRLVLLQRGQIAALKAVGYTNAQVGLHYLKLVSLVSLVGTAIGMAAGACLGIEFTGLYSGVFNFPRFTWTMEPRVAMTAVMVSLLAAAAGAANSVWQVARLPPAEAMRPPSPPTYRQTILDRIGLGLALSQSARMVIREVERTPVRTGLSVLGISLAVGILVVGRFYVDAVDYMLYLQYEVATREDLSVGFFTPLPTRAVREIGALPGVSRAEGLRAVPVRFHSGHLWRDGVLNGYPPAMELRSIIDVSGDPLRIPDEGVMITRKLAELLNVRLGDPVEVEVREGARQRLQLTVSGFADEMIGLNGHMSLDALTRALGEEPTASTVLLKVDPRLAGEVERRLSEMPAVAAVTSREANVQRFREQLGDTVIVMTTIVTLFAITIAIGVVYNNARVALASRSRDLASLRVLGMTRREISAILLGELGFQLITAIPIGLAIGAWMSAGVAGTVDPERIRLPVVISTQTHAFATSIALAAGLASALIVRRQLDRLDLVGVLKERE